MQRDDSWYDTVDEVAAEAYTVPTPAPESDGTLAWDATTIVVVEVTAGTTVGLGYTYASPGAVSVVRETLAEVVRGADVMATGATWAAMTDAVRNIGRAGIAASAIGAVDVALWDLKGQALGRSVADLLGRFHDEVPVYGSGGFTSFSERELHDQLGGWAAQGITAVKMKVGRDPDADPARVATARRAIGDDVALFVDANGAYTRQEALRLATRYADLGVTWFEEPVSSDDLAGLRAVRDAGPSGLEVTAGEYGYDLQYFRRMLTADAVDCLQADVTRCGGITGFVRAGALADGHGIDVSSHTAPHVSAHASAGLWHLRHLEYFADHVRIESLLFDGALEPHDGVVRPDPHTPWSRARAQAHRRRTVPTMNEMNGKQP